MVARTGHAMLWAVVLGAASTAQATPQSYVVRAKDSLLYVQVYKSSGILSGFAHDHVIRASEMTGTLRYDPEDPASCTIHIEVPVRSLQPDEPAMRRRVGYDSMVDEDDRQEVQENMLAEGQLNAARYPTIRFDASSCKRSDKGVVVKGTLTIRGKSKHLQVPMLVQRGSNRLKAKGRVEIRHRDFGIKPYSTGLGTISNQDKMLLVMQLVADPTEG